MPPAFTCASYSGVFNSIHFPPFPLISAPISGRIKKQGTVEQIQECAKNRIIEIPEEKIEDDNILFVEKSYIKEGKKMYRVITKNIDENGVEPTVEDGYLCLLKED